MKYGRSNTKYTRCTSIISSWMCLAGGRKRQRLVCNHWLGEIDYSSLRENAEGGFIGNAEHCKNFKSSNMMMLISRLID